MLKVSERLSRRALISSDVNDYWLGNVLIHCDNKMTILSRGPNQSLKTARP